MADIYKSKFTGEQIDGMLENASRVAKVEANPLGMATEDLTKITIGDITYSIPEGTVVEGNPSGDATVELTKLKIGNNIYSIPQGGVKLYEHTIKIGYYDSRSSQLVFDTNYPFLIKILSPISTPFTTDNAPIHSCVQQVITITIPPGLLDFYNCIIDLFTGIERGVRISYTATSDGANSANRLYDYTNFGYSEDITEVV